MESSFKFGTGINLVEVRAERRSQYPITKSGAHLEGQGRHGRVRLNFTVPFFQRVNRVPQRLIVSGNWRLEQSGAVMRKRSQPNRIHIALNPAKVFSRQFWLLVQQFPNATRTVGLGP